jgi:hypothetical protein
VVKPRKRRRDADLVAMKEKMNDRASVESGTNPYM